MSLSGGQKARYGVSMIAYEVLSDALFDRVALARAVYAVSTLSRRA